ncbi:MAG: hypothetical protein ACI35R_01790 [Bacillus sp. (in: firmicutes)]
MAVSFASVIDSPMVLVTGIPFAVASFELDGTGISAIFFTKPLTAE